VVPQTYVVPLDGSPFAEKAVPVAYAIAERVGGGLLLVSASYRGPIDPGWYLDEVAARFAEVPIDTISNVEHLPADAIATIVEQSDDRIVCMTSHGRGGVRWSMLGSTAEEVIRRADRPTLLVGRRCREDFLTRSDHILACVDTSESSDWIAPVVLEWAERLELKMDAAVVARPRDVESADHAEMLMDLIVDHFGGPDRVSATVLTNANVAGVLADFADDLPAAMIAMNCYGRTGLARIALGSVTMALLHLAACPLLVTHGTP
jgi:nucleotide-binding universal stress UspA family protein